MLSSVALIGICSLYPARARRSLTLGAFAALISRTNGLLVVEDDLDHLLAMNLAACFILQCCDDLFRARIDDLARRRIDVAPVDTESDPAGLVPYLNAAHQFRRRSRGVENVQPAVSAVAHPNLLLVRCHGDAVTRASVALDGPLLVAFHLHPIKLFTCL